MDLVYFGSPIVKPKPNYNTNSPLIPAPKESVCTELPNNPFDEVVNVIELNQQPCDPFDLVLQAALNHDARIKNESASNEKHIVTECHSKFSEDISYISGDIKGFVSQRLNSLIERTYSSTSLRSDDTLGSKQYFRRSFSAGVLPVTHGSSRLLDDSLCSNCCNKLNTSLPTQVSRVSNTDSKLNAIGDFSVGKLADKFKGLSTEDNSEVTKDVLHREAEKIRKILSYETLPNTSDITLPDDKDSGEDLLEIMAPWVTREIQLSDEEDITGLPKVKTVSRSFSSSLSRAKQSLEASAIDKYLRKRNDMDGHVEQPTNDEDTIIESFTPEQVVASSSLLEDSNASIDSVDAEPPKLKDINEDKKIEMPLVKDEINTETLRSKKKAGSEFLKKGPMKAMMPLQKMSKNLTSKLSSPFKNRASSSSITSRKHETKTDCDPIPPVASSTPTKSTESEFDTSASNLRGRENNKMSPTGRKAAKRSVSTSKVETKRKTDDTSMSIKIPSASNISLANKVNINPKKPAARPNTAPSGTKAEKSSIKSNALKLLLPAPMQKLRNSELKGSSRNKIQSSKILKKDKENVLKK